MFRVYTLPDRFVLYYGTRLVLESKSFMYVHLMYLALDPCTDERVLRHIIKGANHD